MPDARQGSEVRAPSCWRDGLGCGIVLIGLLWLWEALLWSTSAFYFLLPYIPYEDRWAYGFGDDDTLTRLVREPLSVAPERIAWACLPVFVLWGGARLMLGRRRSTALRSLGVWLAAFLALSLALSLPLGRGITHCKTWQDRKNLKQIGLSDLMYLRDGEPFRGGADPSGSAETTDKVRERPSPPSPQGKRQKTTTGFRPSLDGAAARRLTAGSVPLRCANDLTASQGARRVGLESPTYAWSNGRRTAHHVRPCDSPIYARSNGRQTAHPVRPYDSPPYASATGSVFARTR